MLLSCLNKIEERKKKETFICMNIDCKKKERKKNEIHKSISLHCFSVSILLLFVFVKIFIINHFMRMLLNRLIKFTLLLIHIYINIQYCIINFNNNKNAIK
jgi:hypothetical protein